MVLSFPLHAPHNVGFALKFKPCVVLAPVPWEWIEQSPRAELRGCPSRSQGYGGGRDGFVLGKGDLVRV